MKFCVNTITGGGSSGNKVELPGLLSSYSKLQWKSFVIKIIQSMNKDDILNMIKNPYIRNMSMKDTKSSLV